MDILVIITLLLILYLIEALIFMIGLELTEDNKKKLRFSIVNIHQNHSDVFVFSKILKMVKNRKIHKCCIGLEKDLDFS